MDTMERLAEVMIWSLICVEKIHRILVACNIINIEFYRKELVIAVSHPQDRRLNRFAVTSPNVIE